MKITSNSAKLSIPPHPPSHPTKTVDVSLGDQPMVGSFSKYLLHRTYQTNVTLGNITFAGSICMGEHLGEEDPPIISHGPQHASQDINFKQLYNHTQSNYSPATRNTQPLNTNQAATNKTILTFHSNQQHSSQHELSRQQTRHP